MLKNLFSNTRKTCLLLYCVVSSLVVTAQTRHKGRVIGSNDKLPIIGATIKIIGANTGTVTDNKGEFILTLKPGDIISVSYIGYQTHNVTVGADDFITIILPAGSSLLNEVVVTGYTTQRKKDITGAIAIVDVDNLKTVASGNTTSLLQGQASGVTVTNSGGPGAGTSINIRGVGSIFSTAPLVLIDGVQGTLDNINVNDIESIQVLKDAGSASIYGVRGANGVIVVTTKKGKQGKSLITYDAFYGTTKALTNGFKVANTPTYIEAEFESYKNDGLVGSGHSNRQFDPKATGTYTVPTYITPSGSNAGDLNTDPSTYNLNPMTGVGSNPITLTNKTGTDWFHQVFRDAPIQQHNITASGGNEKSTYLMSVGYLNQQGTLISTYEKRYSIRANTNFKINDHVRVGENLYWFYKQNPQIGNQNEGNTISYTYREPPVIPVYDIKGNYAGTRSPGLGNSQNPYANAQRALSNVGNDYNISGNVFGEVDFLKNFNFRTSFGGSVDNYSGHSFTPTYYENAEGNTAANGYNAYSGTGASYIWGNYLTYNRHFGKHNVKILAGSENLINNGSSLSGSRGGYSISTDPNYVFLNTGSPTSQSNSDGVYANTLKSYFARIEYAFNDKYLLSGNIRRDGSSFFSSGHQWGTFPSGSLGWRVSKEEFLKDVSWINELKLRGGYGSLGSLGGVINQSNNANNLYNSTAANSYYDINGTGTSSVLGIYKSQVGNLETTWETDKEANIGIDMTILKNRLDFSFDLYRKTVSGLLFKAALFTAQGGASAPYINAGNLENKGFDLTINYHGDIGDLKYNLGLNLSHYANLVKSLPKGVSYLDVNSSGSTRIGNFVRLQPGQPVGEFFGYQQIGLYQTADEVTNSPGYTGAKPGLNKYKDVNNDGKITADDRTFIGDPNPKLTGGFNFQANYKNFDLSALFYGVYGNKVVNYTKYWTDFPQVFDGNVSADILSKSWHPGADNSKATIPILTRQANIGNTGAFNSYYVQNGSFLKLKSLQIGYNIPFEQIKRLGIAKFRFYVLANNLFTITKYNGLDPELQNSNLSDNTSFGIDFGNYPSNEKRYSLGVQVTF